MAHATPWIQQGELNTHEGPVAPIVDSPAWFNWHHIFRFTSPAGTFSVRREQRARRLY